MSDTPPQNPNVPFYLTAPGKAHFRLRPDVIEELCIADAFARTLPRSPEEHARWLAKWGRSAADVPYQSIALAIGRPYELTPRYVLHPAILPGWDYLSNVITDGRGWSVMCEFGGLYEFVFARAVQFCESRGYDRCKVREQLFPKLEKNPGPQCRYGRWALEYERATGFCTIVPQAGGRFVRRDCAAE